MVLRVQGFRWRAVRRNGEFKKDDGFRGECWCCPCAWWCSVRMMKVHGPLSVFMADDLGHVMKFNSRKSPIIVAALLFHKLLWRHASFYGKRCLLFCQIKSNQTSVTWVIIYANSSLSLARQAPLQIHHLFLHWKKMAMRKVKLAVSHRYHLLFLLAKNNFAFTPSVWKQPRF